MTSDILQAFSHPSVRAEALAGHPPRDRILMTDHLREIEIGAFQAERGVRQTVRFDVVVEVDNRAETAVDDVDRILSYDMIVEAIDAALQETRVNLLETLSARIAERILTHPLAMRAYVRIAKLDRGPFTLGVEIVRDAPSAAPTMRLAAEDEAPSPRVVFLSEAAIAREDLQNLLTRLSDGVPLIVCVGHPSLPTPVAAHPMPQRRIALLAIEQMAWVLAGRDARCVVVDSRTELDWGIRNGQICVWAPSKLVLDAHDGPADAAPDAVGLMAWLARALDARDIVVFGADAVALPVECPVSVLDALAMP